MARVQNLINDAPTWENKSDALFFVSVTAHPYCVDISLFCNAHHYGVLSSVPYEVIEDMDTLADDLCDRYRRNFRFGDKYGDHLDEPICDHCDPALIRATLAELERPA